MLKGTITLKPSEKVVFASSMNSSANKNFWWKWLIVITILSLFFAISIDFAPYLHSDEFMIIDLGRIILNPHTEWSIAWITKLDHPALLWSYIGPVVQEFIFEYFGQYGPRISALVGAMVAATTMVGWLHARRVLANSAFIFGVIFFLDPLFVQSYTIGRIDGWAMGLCLAACWIISDARLRLSYNKLFRGGLLLAGALTITAFFTWPSSVFLFPLILLELIYLFIKYRATNKDYYILTSPIVFFGLGACTMGLLLLLPVFSLLVQQFINITEGLKTNTRSGTEGGTPHIFYHFFTQCIALFRIIKFSPILVLSAIVCMAMKRETGLIVAWFTAVLVMLFTVVYIHRVQYLLPYFIAAIAGMYQKEDNLKNKHSTYLLKRSAISLLLLWSIGLSLFIRSALAFNDKTYRNRAAVYKAAQVMIGKGKYKVLIIPYEFYYAGRSLNWQMYKPYLGQNEPFSTKELERILPHVDYVITNFQSEETAGFVQQLKKEGMRYQGDYNIYNFPVEKFNGITTNITRLRNLYSIFYQPYGPYRLYER
ncbi:hypothetical protein [Segetibacter koreensis]|uniref:hypothetical protein n=1 Tax=Segetibacter koreensis TaxID=398037 RepID=UPI0004758848|nr:hypothetical protein [Segetibacter koreensis]